MKTVRPRYNRIRPNVAFEASSYNEVESYWSHAQRHHSPEEAVLTNLSINNFRGLKGLEINPLGRINLLAGKNGAGKTSVLEALWIFGGPDMPELTVTNGRFSRTSSTRTETAFVDLFNGFDSHSTIEIAGTVKPGPKPGN